MLAPMPECKSYYAAWLLPLIVINWVGVQAQQPSPTPIPSPLPSSVSNSTIATSTRPVNTTYTSIYAITLLPNQPRPSGASSQQSIFLTTATITSSISYSTASPSPTVKATASATPTGPPPQTTLPLKTVIDPAFGILGALLIISGIVLSFIGHRSRWLICLLCGFYTLALTTFCIILRVGVSKAVNDPNNTVKGLYLLACLVAGCVGGGLFVIFRNGGLLLSAGLGGFTLALFFQACKSDGMIQTIGIRYILYIILAAISFALACHSKLQPYILIFSSALIGATAFTVGVDCFTKANIKEFYIRNIGFDDIFEAKYPDEFRNHRWFLSSASVIELGVLGGMTIMGIAFQSKMWSEFRTSLIAMRNSDEERQLQAKAKRATKKVLASAKKDLREWEERHGYRKTAGKADVDEEETIGTKAGYVTEKPCMHQRRNSSKSLLPISSSDNDRDTPTVLSKANHPWMPPVEKEYRPARSYSTSAPRSSTSAISPEQQRLLDEIAAIRNSINVLQTIAPTNEDQRSSASHTLADPESAIEKSKRVSPKWMETRTEKVKFRIEFSGRSSNSPWITGNRPRSQSVSNSTSIPVKVSTPSKPLDFFAEGHNLIPQTYQSKYPAPLTISIPSGTPSVAVPSSGISRMRSTSDANYLKQTAGYLPSASASASASASQSRFASLDMMRRADSRESDHHTPSKDHHHTLSKDHHRMEGFYTPKNVYRTLQSDGGGSEVGSVIRFDQRRDSPPPMPRSSSADHPPRPKKKASLSIEELQARHQTLLKAKQTPTSARFEEEVALKRAQEQWEMKKRLDKKYWEERERQVEELSRMKSMSSAGGRPGIAPQRSSSGTSRLDQMPVQSGISRAKDWRRSLIIDDVDAEKVITKKQQRRHSSQMQPLLDFTAETIQQEGRNKMLRQQ